MENKFTLPSHEQTLIQLIDSRIQAFLGNSNSQDSDILDFDEACAFLKIAGSTLYEKTSKRSIPHYKQGKKLYFSKKRLIDWLVQGQVNTIDELVVDQISK